MRQKWAPLLATVLSLGLVLSACGAGSKVEPTAQPEPSPTAAPAPTAPTAPAAPAEQIKVAITMGGTRDSMLYLPPVYAKEAGFFAAEGIDAEIREEKGGAQALQAVSSGQMDFGAMAVEHAAKAHVQGADLVMLVLYWRYPTVTLVVDSKLKDQVKSVADLKGMKVGITSPGSGSHKVLLSLMNQAGMQASDVELVGTGTPGVVDAFAEGKIQAAANYDPFITKLIQEGKVVPLYDTRTQKDTVGLYGGEYPFVGLVTRRDVLRDKPEVVAKVVAAMTKAQKSLIASSPEQISAKLPADVIGADKALWVAAFKANQEALSPTGIASESGLKLVIESLKADNVIPKEANVTPAMVFDGSLASKY